jgi:hypothetical protein
MFKHEWIAEAASTHAAPQIDWNAKPVVSIKGTISPVTVVLYRCSDCLKVKTKQIAGKFTIAQIKGTVSA